MVAGAGSGKTETMASRVVWLVANGYAHPDEILGLTFTRKAAGELAHRVRTRLGQLIRHLGRDDAFAGEATISTYHSYAARIVTALRGTRSRAARKPISASLAAPSTGGAASLIHRAPSRLPAPARRERLRSDATFAGRPREVARRPRRTPPPR